MNAQDLSSHKVCIGLGLGVPGSLYLSLILTNGDISLVFKAFPVTIATPASTVFNVFKFSFDRDSLTVRMYA